MQTKYTTNTKIKAGFTTSLSDGEIDNLISIVSGHIDTYLGFKLACDYATTKDFLVDGSGTEFLVLDQPICAYTGLKSVSIQGSEADVQYVSSKPLNKAYTLFFEAKTGRFTEGVANYKIVGAKEGLFTIDFVTALNHTLPYDVEQCVIEMVRFMIDGGAKILTTSSAENEKSGKITQESMGSYSASYANDSVNFKQSITSIPNASGILGRYKDVEII